MTTNQTDSTTTQVALEACNVCGRPVPTSYCAVCDLRYCNEGEDDDRFCAIEHDNRHEDRLAQGERVLSEWDASHGIKYAIRPEDRKGLALRIATVIAPAASAAPTVDESTRALSAERVANAARQFCEELQEDAEGVPPLQLTALNEALDAWEAYPDARKSFDDSQPVLAALASLIEDQNATDHQRRVAHLALAALQGNRNVLTATERNEVCRAIAESDIAGCSLENSDIDALVDLFESWLERRAAAASLAVAMPLLDYICADCRVQQHADGICANCESPNLVKQSAVDGDAREVVRGWTRTGVNFGAFHPNGVPKMRADLEDDLAQRITAHANQRYREGVKAAIEQALHSGCSVCGEMIADAIRAALLQRE